ncbi:MAG: DUF1631 family protein [Betaproteobacteria bacterium]
MSVAQLSNLSIYDPSLLSGLRDQLASTFAAKIGAVLPEVNGFIEFESELASNASERLELADAAQLLYSRHASIEAHLAATFVASFDTIVDPVATRSRRSRNPLSTLRLVDDQQMAEEIALIDCTNRLKEQADYELFELSRGIALLLGRERLTDETNPVFPRVFANALLHALGSIKSNTAANLAMFKAFGPLLLEILPATYRVGTEWLKQHGVELDAYVFRPVVAAERPNLVAQTPAVPATDTALIEELLKTLRSAQADTGPAGQTTAASSAPAPNSIKTELADPPRQLVLTERILLATFDVLSKDAQIPMVMRLVIARLNDSMLRLVSKDAGFLTHSTHPARKLLELLAEAGTILELNDEAASTVDMAARIVEDAIRAQDNEPRAFATAFERLDALIAAHEEIALQKDPAIRLLQQSELRECAHDAANVAIGKRLDGRTLPPEITTFVLITWRAVLVADYLHGGIDGQAWKLGVATLDELLKSIEPVTRHEDRTVRAHLLSSLIELIRDGIAHAQMHDLLADDFLHTLQTLHLRALQGKRDANHDGQVPLSFAYESAQGTAPAPSAAESLARAGLVRGSYVEIREDSVAHRWRLCWISPFRGHCLLKQYESHTSKVVNFDVLLADVAAQETQVVDGLGLVGNAISMAFKQVNRTTPQRAPNTPALKLVPVETTRPSA